MPDPRPSKVSNTPRACRTLLRAKPIPQSLHGSPWKLTETQEARRVNQVPFEPLKFIQTASSTFSSLAWSMSPPNRITNPPFSSASQLSVTSLLVGTSVRLGLACFLVGRPPRDVPAVAVTALPDLPPLPSAGVPVDLLRRRPDVRAAEQDLLAAGEDSQAVRTYEPSVKALLEHLVPVAVETQLQQAFFNSVAAELAARRMAMDSATDNAGELIKELTLMYNRERQAAITTELMEIVGGSEALKG